MFIKTGKLNTVKAIQLSNNAVPTTKCIQQVAHVQCDQIGRFIGLWASFQNLCATISLPKSPTFLGTFIDIWRLFTGHTAHVIGKVITAEK